MAWVTGNRDIATFRRLYAKVKHLKKCIFYTDGWDAFSAVLPQERHIVGKSHTHIIEANNSETRHNIARFTRRTKVVSKSSFMVNLTMKLWVIMLSGGLFESLRDIVSSIL